MSQAGIKTAKHVHFTGIKGVGMTAAALCLQDLGIPVSGSDIAQEFVTNQVLKQRQVPVTTDFSPEDIPPPRPIWSLPALIWAAKIPKSKLLSNGV
jgi:UDP-N-acetylmuramate-alanine ligase